MCVHYSGTVSSPIVSTLERVAESFPQLTVHWDVPQSQTLNILGKEKETIIKVRLAYTHES